MSWEKLDSSTRMGGRRAEGREGEGTSDGARVNRVALSNPAGQEVASQITVYPDLCSVYWKQDCMWIQAVLDRQEVIQHQLRLLAGGRTVSQISVADRFCFSGFAECVGVGINQLRIQQMQPRHR